MPLPCATTSTGTAHGRIEQLRDHRFVGYFVTVTLHPRIYLTIKIFFANVTFGLRFSHESNNLQNVASADLSVVIFHGVEINNHVRTFRSELHWSEPN